MKIVFDTNVYVAESILSRAARRMIQATLRAKWRIYASNYLLDEVRHVLSDDFDFSSRLAWLTQRRMMKRCRLVKLSSKAKVAADPKDSPILQTALSCGADYLVSNDRHLLTLDPFEGLQIVSMSEYYSILQHEGLLR